MPLQRKRGFLLLLLPPFLQAKPLLYKMNGFSNVKLKYHWVSNIIYLFH